jgi:hypothetical protein
MAASAAAQHPDIQILTVSHSELATWARCPRRWFLGTYLRWGNDPERGPVTGNAQLGNRIHLALEAQEGYGIAAIAALDFIYKMAVTEHPEAEEALEKERDMAFAMMEGFLQWAAEEGYNAGYEVTATERETSVYLPFMDGKGEFRLIAKLDALVRRLEDGATLFRDYKTVTSLSKANRLPISSQMKTYSLIQALQARDNPELPRADGGQYVMLRRSKRTARAEGPFYATAEFSYNRDDLNGAWYRVRQLATEIRDARAALDAGAPHQAVARYVEADDCEWYCPFFRVCAMLDDGSRWEDALRGNYVQADPYARYKDNAIQEILEVFGKGRKDNA